MVNITNRRYIKAIFIAISFIFFLENAVYTLPEHTLRSLLIFNNEKENNLKIAMLTKEIKKLEDKRMGYPRKENYDLYEEYRISDSLTELQLEVLYSLLEEGKLRWQLLREMGYFDNRIVIDLAQGPNPAISIAADVVIGINDHSLLNFRNIFIDNCGAILGLTREEIRSRIIDKEADVTSLNEISKAIEEAENQNDSLKGLLNKTWFINSIDEYVKFEDVQEWVEEMNSLVREDDLIIISGRDRNNLGMLFSRDGDYEDVCNDLPSDILGIIKTGIPCQFNVCFESHIQYIHPFPGPLTILKKKGNRKTFPHDFLNRLKETRNQL